MHAIRHYDLIERMRLRLCEHGDADDMVCHGEAILKAPDSDNKLIRPPFLCCKFCG